MEGFQFRDSYYLYLLIAVLPLGWLCYFLLERRKRALIALMGETITFRANSLNKYYRFRAIIILLAVILSIIGLARPQWGKTQKVVETKGVDVIIAVDVSLSMLAIDEPPSRLARARRLCIDLMDSLKENRIGIVAFAANNVGLMPLTLDKVALESFIDSLDVELASSNSGTSIEQAISQATESLKNSSKDLKVLVLISDGEEQSDDPENAVRKATEQASQSGIIILSVGVGSLKGSKIPLDAVAKTGFKLDEEGKEVITKLQENLLQIAATESAGIYTHTQPDTSEVKQITGFIDKLNKGEVQSLAIQDREERFQYFLALALLLILTDLLLAPYLLKWVSVDRA